MQLSDINSNQIQDTRLNLGSIVNCKEVLKAEKYQRVLFTRSGQSAQLKDAEFQIELLDAKIAKQKIEALVIHYNNEKSAYQDLCSTIKVKLNKALPEKPQFENLPLNSVSIVNPQSPTCIKKDGCQTCHTSFEMIKEEFSYIEKKKRTSFKELTALITEKPEYVSLGDELTTEMNGKVLERIIHIQEHHKCSIQTLLKSAIKTGYTQSFQNIDYDRDVLQKILTAMQNNDQEMMNAYGVSNYKTEKAIAFVKQADLGGFFMGIASNAIELKSAYENYGITDGQNVSLQESSVEGKINLEFFSQGMESHCLQTDSMVSILEIFNECIKSTTSNPNAGVPVDFSYQILTQSMIKEILDKS